MIRIELTEREVEKLRELCEGELEALRTEAFRTDSAAYRDTLRQNAALVKELLGRLPAPVRAA